MVASSSIINQYLCTSNAYGFHGPVYECTNCGLVFVVDNISTKSILDNYDRAEDPIYVAEQQARIQTFARHVHNLEKHHPKGKLLDVGAYTGLFLYQAKLAGWQVSGIEPSSWAVSQSKKLYGLDLKHGIFKSGSFPKNSFDVVTMWDVIEHFINPIDAINIAYSYLSPGGVLAMSTIDVKSPVARILGKKWPWFMCMHRVYFSKETMIRALKQAGFINIKYYPHIRYISLRYFLSRFSSLKLPFDDIIIPFYIGDLFDVYAQKSTSGDIF